MIHVTTVNVEVNGCSIATVDFKYSLTFKNLIEYRIFISKIHDLFKKFIAKDNDCFVNVSSNLTY